MPWLFESAENEERRFRRVVLQTERKIMEVRNSLVRTERHEERRTPMSIHRTDISPHSEKAIRAKEKRDARTTEIIRLRFEEWKTYEQIGKVFNISRERVRQILKAEGIDPALPKPPEEEDKVCPVCKTVYSVKRGRTKKYCSKACRSKTTLMGKPQKEFTKEDWKEYNRIHNYGEGSVRARLNYMNTHREEIYAKNREYQKTYSKRPEVIAKQKAWLKEKMKDPVWKRKFYDRMAESRRRRLERNPEFREHERIKGRIKYHQAKAKKQNESGNQ